MTTHFLLQSAAVPLSLEQIALLNNEQAWNLLREMRWGTAEEMHCPDCGVIDSHYFIRTRKQWRCRHCGHTFSVTSGTPFSDHKISYRKLAMAIFAFVISHKGLAALQLRRIIGGQYRTAFTLLHKIRESIMLSTSLEPTLEGVVEIDGGHFSGKKRKGRKIQKPKPEEKTDVPKKYLAQHRNKLPAQSFPMHPNRRIVMVLRQVFGEKGKGAAKTVTVVCRSENAADVKALIASTVKQGSTIRTDELPAYGDVKLMGYIHETVNHSKEFSTDSGINQNQAESYFSRMRRACIGIYHRITPKYMLDYSREMAWREDHRRESTYTQFAALAKLILNSMPSVDWQNYTKDPKFKRQAEILFQGASPAPV